MALTFTIQGGTPPPPTTSLACGAFNGIDARVGSLLSLMEGGRLFWFAPPPYENFCGHPCSMIMTN